MKKAQTAKKTITPTNAPIFNPQEIESYWQSKWNDSKVYQPDLDTAKRPFYNLMMFPYPSAEGMHVGNMYAFTGADIYGRFMRMKGNDVFEPIGLDGFGIHSENFALKVGRHPTEQAKVSEANFYRQLKATGNGFDWSRTVETYDPQYYKWTQWLFIQLFKMGLAYRKKAPVNFCPSCKTVLADEQVIDGKCERCSTLVEKRDLEQWFFKITTYADRLLNNLEKLDWTDKVKIAQKEWIGRKEGINITYKVEDSDTEIVCFTTRPDTNFGATFIVIGPEHPLIEKLTKSEHAEAVNDYIKKTKEISEVDRIAQGRKKTGVFTGSYAINNLNGSKLPVWVSDFVIGTVGTGAVVGVPGHDMRDFEFAQEFDIPILRVVVGSDGDSSEITKPEQVQEEEGTMIHSEFLDGMEIMAAKEKIMDYLVEKGWGEKVTSYHLRDWLISRQRYWGPPIPMIHCETCSWQPVPADELPVLLPEVEDWKPKGNGVSPLANVESFVKTTCPKCGADARRETDVSDTFLDSAWYFFRYISTEDSTRPFDIERAKKWLPVDMYIGGAEHSVLHLLYSRFVTMVLHDLGLISFEEPYNRFYAHGLLIKEGSKMSKSKGNVVVPDEYIKKFGADTLRTYLMFTGPYNQGGDFRDTGIEGMSRFLRRVWTLVTTSSLQENDSIDSYLNLLIKGVTEDLEALRYNTAISKIMMYYNYLVKKKDVTHGEVRVLVQLFAPFAPHMTEELWKHLGQEFSIHIHLWPEYTEQVVKEVTINVQVNGKFRGAITVKAHVDQKEVEEKALKEPNIARSLEGKKIQKVIYVPQKALNFVVS